MTARILIPDWIDLAPQAALRGLGRRGDRCDVAWPIPRHIRPFLGRYCRDVIEVPSPGKQPADYGESILALARSGRYDVVLPTRGISVEALLPRADELSRCVATLLPSAEQFRFGIDKMATFDMCRSIGVPYPDTEFLTPEARPERIAESFGYPVVVKHRRNFGASLGVRMASDPAALAESIDYLASLSGSRADLMLQRFLPGTIFDACVVARDGRIGGIVTQERRLMKPTSGGVASILATVDHPQLTELARHVIETLRWNGPAQLEFKWDAERRTFSLIEINPRFWATTGAWLKAGANFPAVAVDLALGRDPGVFPRLPPNLRFMYLMGRVPYSLLQLYRIKGRHALRDPRHYDRTWYDFDRDDPLPDLYRLYQEISFIRKVSDRGPAGHLPAGLDPSFAEQAIPVAAARSDCADGRRSAA